MSLQIPCRFCGERPVEEFYFGEIPQVPEQVTDPVDRDLARDRRVVGQEHLSPDQGGHNLGIAGSFFTTRRVSSGRPGFMSTDVVDGAT